MALLYNVPRRVMHFVTFLFGEGDWRLHPHERVVVDAVMCDLPLEIRKVVQAQLAHAFFVERSSNRISVIRFYGQESLVKIADAKFEDLLVKVQIEIDGRKQISHVTFYNGCILTVEFKKPRQFYVGKRITICGVSQGKPEESYAYAVDRLEHGRREEDGK